jgi:hypothetical protein
MSKLKKPAEKKEASYEHDHRSAEAETNKGARKAIPLAKARAKRAERHSVHQALVQPEAIDADDADEVEDEAEVIETAVANTKLKRLKGFKKTPAVRLGDLVAEKLASRAPGAKKPPPKPAKKPPAKPAKPAAKQAAKPAAKKK